MAGDWIVVEHATPNKPEVFAIAEDLGIEPDAVFGKLMRVWIWADEQTYDGNAVGVTFLLLNRLTDCDGFAEAMIRAGWLTLKSGKVSFPNFDRLNGDTAKTRALTRKRVRKHRNAATVTLPLPEKRREEKKLVERKFVKPTIQEVTKYCLKRNNGIDPQAFLDHYEANGWKRGQTPIKDWKACVRTWEARRREETKPAASRLPTPEEDANWNPTDGGLG